MKNRFFKLLPILTALIILFTSVTSSAKANENINANTYDEPYIDVLEEGEEPDPDPQPTTDSAPDTEPETKPTDAPKHTDAPKPTDAPRPTSAPTQRPNQTPNTPNPRPTAARPGVVVPERPTAGNVQTEAAEPSSGMTERTTRARWTAPDNTFVEYTSPDLSISDSEENARHRRSLIQAVAAVVIGLAAAGVLIFIILREVKKNKDN